MKNVLIMVFLATAINIDQCDAKLPTKEEMEEFVTIIGFSKQADALGEDGSIDRTKIKIEEPTESCSLCKWVLRSLQLDKSAKNVMKLAGNEDTAELSQVGFDIFGRLTSENAQIRTDAWAHFMQAPALMHEVCVEAENEGEKAKRNRKKKRAWDMYMRVVGCQQFAQNGADEGRQKISYP